MSSNSEHNDIIARAAQARLAPLGCERVGRSRVWLSDQRAWVIMIEFQPSGFAKGSYLNVAPSWLWYPKSHLTFDYGPVRFGELVAFEGTQQFEPQAEAMAKQAAQSVEHFRDELGKPIAIAAQLVKSAGEGTCWPAYYAAVAAGLVGEMDTSLRLFTQIIKARSDVAWFSRLQNLCDKLAEKLVDHEEFRKAVLAIITRTRVLNKLREDSGCLSGW
jgi:hypothetical protein